MKIKVVTNCAITDCRRVSKVSLVLNCLNFL